MINNVGTNYHHTHWNQWNIDEQLGRLAFARERISDRHLYRHRGAKPGFEGTSFQVFAPNARSVHLVLTAFGREEHVIPMHRNAMNVWEVFTKHAFPSRTYNYLIEDQWGNWKKRTDPYSLSVMETEGTCQSVVCSTDSYSWKDGGWMAARSQRNPLREPLSIYELSAEHWKKQGCHAISFRQLAHHIVDYQKSLQFTHVELYGVLDHKSEQSWGYQTDHFFAVNRRMGNADDFKYLVDLCHQNGIGVILDWNGTHYKHEHHGDMSQSLHNYDGTDLFGAEYSQWDTLFFDYNKEETRRLALSSALYWFEVMHVDGLRVDAVDPLLSRGGDVKSSAVQFIKELNAIIHEYYPGALMIAEDSGGFPNATVPVDQGGLGFDAKVGIHLQSRVRNYFKTSYEQRGWNEHHCGKLLANLGEMGGKERWLLGHSHDDAAAGSWHQHGTLYSGMPSDDSWRKFADMRLFHAWNLLTPGVGHMIHMGDEMGQKWAWNGRLNAGEGSVEWHLLDDPQAREHRNLFNYIGDLNRLYRAKPAFWKHEDYGYRMISHSPENQIIGFNRFDFQGGRLALFYNFSTMGYTQYDFPLNGDPELNWVQGVREIFNSDGAQYGGTGNFRNQMLSIFRNDKNIPTQYRFAIAPLSLVVFEELWGV